MLTAQQLSNLNRATAERGVVDCEKCRTPIYVNKPASVSVEFSVPCPHCGHRGIYFKRMLVTETIPERRGNRRA
jgi:DNA-directed RNA polymerase subunit RPC12/RpoP